MKIFSGNANKPLADKIAKHLNLQLSPLEITVFPDGEKRVKVNDEVLDINCVVVQPTSTPPDQNYMELFLIIDALKRSGAKTVTAVVPYLGYQRQDHIFREGEDVSLEVVIETLQKTGMDRILAFDLHSIRIPELFQVPVVHLSALPLFAKEIKKDFDLKEIVLVSPDMGGIRRIKEIAEMLENIPYATVVKNRDLNTGQINDSELNGDVRGKVAVIVDDMIATGATLVDAANMLLENGATKVVAFATHPVFAGEAAKILQESKIERVVVTDTIEVSKAKQFAKLEILSISEETAQALKEI